MGNSICSRAKRHSQDSILPIMATGKFSAEIIESAAKHTTTLIFLHGLGDNGSGWAMSLKNVVPKHCKIICPNASVKPVTLNGGAPMPSWFDIYGLGPDSREDEAGIKAASKDLTMIVNKEIDSGIPANKIAIGGFSQGGALALYNALCGPVKAYAGVVALSTWFALNSSFKSNPNVMSCDKNVPIFQCHGKMDSLVPIQFGMITNTFLKQLGMTDVKFKVYPYMDHSSCDEEMKDVTKFLNEILGD